ncbi:hypothetical protein EPI10_030819 [Gossypium australe]|uniref:Uncharacterized protein n=1 Tax=Gossypium australe TaxID=47621 RepID=A0A5B6WYA9_9ROSI|nr:hypothetical protein EPI10_030819 [Gossypium australe]
MERSFGLLKMRWGAPLSIPLGHIIKLSLHEKSYEPLECGDESSSNEGHKIEEGKGGSALQIRDSAQKWATCPRP